MKTFKNEAVLLDDFTAFTFNGPHTNLYDTIFPECLNSSEKFDGFTNSKTWQGELILDEIRNESGRRFVVGDVNCHYSDEVVLFCRFHNVVAKLWLNNEIIGIFPFGIPFSILCLSIPDFHFKCNTSAGDFQPSLLRGR